MFPTLGTFTKKVIDLTGALAGEKQKDALFSETEKKSLQKLIGRLANEEGDLYSQFDTAMKHVDKIFTSVSPNTATELASRHVIHELARVYTEAISSELTFKNKEDSLKWLIEYYFYSRLLFSSYKNAVKYNLAKNSVYYPADSFWFLPDGDAGNTAMSKYFAWLYSVLDTSRTGFHYPGKNSREVCNEKQRHLEQATEWSRKAKVPKSWILLKKNISAGLDRHDHLTGEQKKHYLFAGFLARIATQISAEVESEFGHEFHSKLVEKIKAYISALELHCKIMQEITTQIPNTQNGRSAAIDYYCEKLVDGVKSILTNLSAANKDLAKDELVQMEIGDAYRSRLGLQPSNVVRANDLIHAYKHREYNDSIKNHVEKVLSDETDDDNMLWLAKAVKVRHDLSQGAEFRDVFSDFKTAWENGKYRAGKLQQTLIKDLLFISAKSKDKRMFKKVLSWAEFTGFVQLKAKTAEEHKAVVDEEYEKQLNTAWHDS